MLTGDNSAAAKTAANQIGIDEVQAELLPQDKIEKVRSMLAAMDRWRWSATA